MKKILALVLVMLMTLSLAACGSATHITVDDPAKIMLEKAGGTVAITLTDEKTVDRITGVVEQIPLKAADAAEDEWTYRITWQDADGRTITTITLAGTKIEWEGKTYNVGLDVDLSALTDMLETIPGLNKSE